MNQPGIDRRVAGWAGSDLAGSDVSVDENGNYLFRFGIRIAGFEGYLGINEGEEYTFLISFATEED